MLRVNRGSMLGNNNNESQTRINITTMRKLVAIDKAIQKSIELKKINTSKLSSQRTRKRYVTSINKVKRLVNEFCRKCDITEGNYKHLDKIFKMVIVGLREPAVLEAMVGMRSFGDYYSTRLRDHDEGPYEGPLYYLLKDTQKYNYNLSDREDQVTTEMLNVLLGVPEMRIEGSYGGWVLNTLCQQNPSFSYIILSRILDSIDVKLFDLNAVSQYLYASVGDYSVLAISSTQTLPVTLANHSAFNLQALNILIGLIEKDSIDLNKNIDTKVDGVHKHGVLLLNAIFASVYWALKSLVDLNGVFGIPKATDINFSYFHDRIMRLYGMVAEKMDMTQSQQDYIGKFLNYYLTCAVNISDKCSSRQSISADAGLGVISITDNFSIVARTHRFSRSKNDNIKMQKETMCLEIAKLVKGQLAFDMLVKSAAMYPETLNNADRNGVTFLAYIISRGVNGRGPRNYHYDGEMYCNGYLYYDGYLGIDEKFFFDVPFERFVVSLIENDKIDCNVKNKRYQNIATLMYQFMNNNLDRHYGWKNQFHDLLVTLYRALLSRHDLKLDQENYEQLFKMICDSYDLILLDTKSPTRQEERLNKLKILFRKVAKLSPNTRVGTKGQTFLMRTLAEKYDDFTRSLLESDELNVNIQDSNGIPALIYALKYGASESLIHRLLEKGAYINQVYKFGDTAFSYLVKQKHCSLELVKQFLGMQGRTDVSDSKGNTVLMSAIKNGHVEGALLILKRNPSNVNAVNNEGQTALMLAAELTISDARLMSGLLNAGANIYQEDNKGLTARLYAAKVNNWVTGVLLDKEETKYAKVQRLTQSKSALFTPKTQMVEQCSESSQHYQPRQ